MTDRLAIDLYAGDGDFNFQAVVDAGPQWSLFALKLSQGTYYTGSPWAERMYPGARRALGDRYGVDGFRVPYHYLDVGVDGSAQASFFLKRLEACGGIGHGDPFVMLDVERSGQRRTMTRKQIVDCALAWVVATHAATGLRTVIYGGEYLRENGIKVAELGCEYAWVADYEAKLRPTHYTDLGVDIAHLVAWQYGGLEGDGHEEAHLEGYPSTSPAGPCDLSAITLAGGGEAAIAELHSWCVRSMTD